MKPEMIINGMHFEVVKKRDKSDFDAWVRRTLAHSGEDLYDHYDKPSRYKQEVYDEWHEWYCETNANLNYFGVSSASCQMFTLTMLLEDIDENPYAVLYITRDHNRYITY